MTLLQDILTEAYDHHPGNVNDLVMFADNTENLHNKGLAIRGSHQKFMDDKSYDKSRALGQWLNFANQAAKAYASEIERDPSKWNAIFSVSDRKRAAKIFADHFDVTHKEHEEFKASEEQEEVNIMDYKKEEQEEVGSMDHEMDFKMPHDMDDKDYDDGSHLDVDHDYDDSKEMVKKDPEMDSKMADDFIRGAFKK